MPIVAGSISVSPQTSLETIEAQTLLQMENLLGELASAWRMTKVPELVTKYQVLLVCMLDLGWQGTVEYEDHLPSYHMPPQYTEHLIMLREKRRASMSKVPDWRDFQ